MSESVGNASSATPDIKELKSFMDAQRVYEELGSKKTCQALIDKAPKLIYEDELDLRLHKRDGKLKHCKVYIFNDYFLVGSQRLRKRKPQGSKSGMEESTGMTTASSSDSGVVWFGSNKASEESSQTSKDTPDEPVLDYDSDISYTDFVKDIAKIEEQKERKDKRLYNLKMWVDLGKVKPRIQRGDGMYGIAIVYVSKVQVQVAPGEFRYNTVVDQAEIWMQDEAKAKTICGLIQDAVDKKALEALREISKKRKAEERQKQRQMSLKSDYSLTDTDTDNSIPSVEGLGRNNSQPGESTGKLSTKSGSTLTARGERRRRAKERLKRGKEALQATIYNGAMSPEQRKNAPKVALSYKDVQERYKIFQYDFDIQSDQKGVAEIDEGLEAEFIVNFKNSQLGLALSSGKHIGPFVCRTIPKGLAEASGVCPGDKLVAINDIEINTSQTWQECVQIIAAQRDEKSDLLITFRRKQKNELQRVQKEEAQLKAYEEQKLKEEEEKLAEEEGEVLPVEDTPVLGESKTLKRFESVELRRKTDDGSNIPKYTLKRKKTGKRKWARKRKILEDMKNLNVGRKEFKEFRKHKKEMFDLYENVENLFATVMHHSPSKEESTCIHALKEIYDTEYKYHANLSHLRGMQMALLTAQKKVICKHLKSSKPFCEHRRPRRYCTQESSFTEEAIDHKLVNSIFLNLKPIIKANKYLWRNLQTKLGELYKKAADNTKVEVLEMLEVYCDVFIEIAPFLQLYWNYCSRYTGACEKQRILRKENHFFFQVVRPTEKKINMKLPNLLAKPVQRVTRYHLLFETLMKHAQKYLVQQTDAGMSKEHLDRLEASTKRLEHACNMLKTMATKVNDKVGEATRLDEMLPIYDEIGGKGEDKIPDLIAPYRRFDSKHEVGYEHSFLDISQDKTLMYLFNDKMAFAVVRDMTTVKKGSKYSYMRLLGNNRATSFSKTKKKISMGTIVSEQEAIEAKKKLSMPLDQKKKSTQKNKKKSLKDKGGTLTKKLSLKTLRMSNERLTTKTNRVSIGSKGSKGSDKDLYYYEVLFHFPIREIGVISDRNKKQDDTTLYGIDIYYSKKHKGGSDTTCLTVWVDEKEKRDKLKNLINNLVQEDKEKRAELKRIRDEKLGKKRRNWAKKRDGYKKGSIPILPGNRAKSSTYSKA